MSAEEMRAIEENIYLENEEWDVPDYSDFADAITDYEESCRY